MDYLRYSLRIRRVEYRIAEVPIFLIPALIVVHARSEIFSWLTVAGLAAFFFMFAFGDLLNCYADRELDATYKPQLTEAVYGIGLRGVLGQAAVSAIGALAIAIYIAADLDRWLLVPMTVIGLVVAWAYSVEPIRLKRRGPWQLLFYWLGLFVAPMLFAAAIYSSQLEPRMMAVAGAFALVQTGVLLINTAEDFPEDRELGVRTVVVALGIHRGAQMAFRIAVAGSVALVAVLAFLFTESTGPSWRWGALGLVIAACVFCTVTLAQLNGELNGTDEDQAIDAVKQAAKKVPIWMSTVALSTFAAAIALSPLVSNGGHDWLTFTL